MARDTPPDVDPPDPADLDPDIGEGLLEDDQGPGASLAHLYRAESDRMQLWRARLDRTTNWAVIVMSAVLTWAFSSRNNPHYVVLLGAAMLLAFLVVEARRYEGYDCWRGRVRKLQRNVYAYGLDPPAGLPNPMWREELSEDYRDSAIKISFEEAIAHRLRRIYLFLLSIMLTAWAIRIVAFSGSSWPESAAIGTIPGLAVTATVAVVYLVAVVVAYRPRTWQSADELHERAVGRHR